MSVSPTLPAPRRRLWLAAAFALAVAAPWLLLDRSPPVGPRSSPQPPSDTTQLARAQLEARDNCLVAALLADGVPVAPPWFQTAELRRALDTDLLAALAHGELPALRDEARWLERLHVAKTPAPRSWADAQLLTAAIHTYLLAAQPPLGEAGTHVDPEIDPARLRAYAGLEVDDLLGTWD